MSVLKYFQEHGYSSGFSRDTQDFTETWMFICDSNEQTWRSLLEAAPEFTPGRIHSSFPLFIVDSFDVDQVSDTNGFRAEVNYVRGSEESPLDGVPRIHMSTNEVEMPVLQEPTGEKRYLINTAGDPIEGVTEPESHWVLNIERDVPSFPKWLLDYPNAINSDSVRIRGITFPPKTLQLKGLTISDEQSVEFEEQDITYYTLAFQLHYNPQGWTRKFLNRGYREVVDPNAVEKELRVLENAEGPVSQPVFLNADGQAYRFSPESGDDTLGKLRESLTPEEILTIERDTKPVLPFSVLPYK